MSDFANPPDDCLVCGREYDFLETITDSSELQTQGKTNICITHHSENGTVLFVHFTEKYL